MSEEKPKYLQVLQSNIRRIRNFKGLKQKEVAAQGKMTQAKLSKLEVENYDPRISTIYQVSEALDIEMHELFRDPNPTDLSIQNTLSRILNLDLKSQEHLLHVIQAYLENYEAKHLRHPNAEERIAQLEAIRKAKEK